MSSENDERVADGIVGMPASEAVNTLVAEDPARDSDTVRAVLDHVTDDGVVTTEAVDETFSDASMTLSTAETRTELAAMALSDAREAAAPVSDLPAVESRLEAFESRAAELDRRVTDLGSDLLDLVRRRGERGVRYDLVTGLRRVTSEARTVQRTADDVQADLESFERWVADADVRVRELREDADAVERSLDALAETAGELERADRRDGETPSLPGTDDAADAGGAWADATLRHRVADLLLADARAELSDLRRWADRDGLGELGVDRSAFDARADELETRLDELDERCEAVGGRIDGAERPAWTDRHGDRLAAFDSTLADFEPPVSWEGVRAELERHRPTGDERSTPP